MAEETINLNQFLKLTRGEIVKIVRQHGWPRTGIFVPDGNRRMTFIESRETSESENFYSNYVELTTSRFLENLKVFFSHGLPVLIVPLISPSVLERSENYLKQAILPGLKTIFQSPVWLDFYKQFDVRLAVYGNLNLLNETPCAEVRVWIEDALQKTTRHQSHRLFLGFASPQKPDTELCRLAIDFYQKNGRVPDYGQQVQAYYGENIPTADFFIMSTKFSGLGALPPLLTGEKTQLYFLAVPGVLALTETAYRKILFDFLFSRRLNQKRQYQFSDTHQINTLKSWFAQNQTTIFGLGHKIGDIWVPGTESESE